MNKKLSKNKIKDLWSKIASILWEPFSRDFSYLAIVFILICLPFEIVFLKKGESFFIIYAVAYAFHCFFISYLIILVKELLPSRLLKILYFCIVLIVATAVFTIDIFTVYKYNDCLYEDVYSILKYTNGEEAREYLLTYLDIYSILLIIGSISIILVVYFGLKQIRMKGPLFIICKLVMLIGLVITVARPTMKKNTIVGKVEYCLTMKEIPDLRSTQLQPAIKIEKESTLPDKVILIIGESFPRNHSSLYGYYKETNPCLSKLKEKGNLFVVRDPRSSATHTIEVFKTLLNTSKLNEADKKEWYKHVFLPEVARVCGYKTFWISNQSKCGVYDNIAAKHAYLCDSIYYNGDVYSGMSKQEFDGEIINILRNHRGKRNEKSFYFFHLLGSHPAFDKRYPQSYARFKINDYYQFSDIQRYMRATLDNSILYNDWVVSILMEEFKNEDAIVVYLPDHGLDVYESSDKYCGHGNGNNEKSRDAGKKIPMFIYVSDEFKRRHSKTAERISVSCDKSYNTENLIYTMMDLIGVDFKDNNDVRKYSLLSISDQ